MPDLNLLIIGLAIFASYLGYRLFLKTKIPESAVLLLVGLALGPVYGVVDPASMLSLAPVVMPIILVILLFDNILDIDLRNFSTIMKHVLQFNVLHLFFCMAFLSVAMNLLLGWGYVYGALLGSVLCGVTFIYAAVFLPRMNVSEKLRKFLTLESIVDAWYIIVAVILLQYATVFTAETNPLLMFFAFFFGGLAIGTSTGAIWAYLWKEFGRFEFRRTLTLALLLLIFYFAETIGAGGYVAIGAFSFMFAYRHKANSGEERNGRKILAPFKDFLDELNFIFRTLFFIYLGVVVDLSVFNNEIFLAAAAITAILVFARFLAVYLVGMRQELLKKYRYLVTFFVPRGLTPAILALTIASHLQGTYHFVEITFLVIIATNLVASIALWAYQLIPKNRKTSSFNPQMRPKRA